jgi:ligand-binding sensor domain-containing protein
MATSCTIINLLQLIQTASKKIAALTILFVNTFFISARAQNINYSFENPNGIPGISENYINVITQDKTGFIWIGSDDGLAKFDGYNTVVYRHKADDANSIPDDQILALLPDDDGNLWIGTRNGLSKYDSRENKFENFFHDSINSKSLAGNHVYGIAKDKDGNIWIALYGAGLDVIEKKIANSNTSKLEYVFRHFIHDEKDSGTMSSNQVFSVCFDKAGNGWIGTEDGLNFLDISSKKFRRFYADSSGENSIANISAYKLFPANDGSVWICGKSMIDRINSYEKNKSYSFSIKHYLPLMAPGENLANWNINRFILDENNNGWVATNDFGLIKFSLTKNGSISNIERIYKNEALVSGIASSVVNEIFEDRSGLIWIGTGRGLSKYIPSKKMFNESPYTNDLRLTRSVFCITRR